MSTFCQIEVDLGVICSCMPSLPALFRPLIERLMGKRKLSTDKTLGYRTPWSRRTVTGELKGSATVSTASYTVPSRDAERGEHKGHTAHRSDQIHAITTIDQTYWQNDSDDLPLQGAVIEHGVADHGCVRSQAWAGVPAAGSYGVSRQAGQRGESGPRTIWI